MLLGKSFLSRWRAKILYHHEVLQRITGKAFFSLGIAVSKTGQEIGPQETNKSYYGVSGKFRVSEITI
jgi:hypothetical protein